MTSQTLLPGTDNSSLQLRVDSAIRQHPHLRGAQIQQQTEGGSVTLKGTVGTFFLKQMAQEAVLGVEGAEVIDNQLQVAWQH